jgi:lysozyme
MRAAGIDVSHYQGHIDWPALARSRNVDFAYIKATDGVSFVDPLFSYNYASAQACGLPRGLYHFLRHGEILQQIGAFLQALHDNLISGGNLPSVCDAESSDLTVAEVLEFLEAVPFCVLYTDLSMITAWGQEAEALTRFPLWIAAPGVVGINGPKVTPWKQWTFWQDSQGRVPGIPTPVDLDTFNGTAADLKASIEAIERGDGLIFRSVI